MKLSRTLTIASIGVTSLAALLAAGCSSSSSTVITVEDSGTPTKDTGTPEKDSGAPGKDSGTPVKDTGAPGKDTGPTGSDKTDAGGPPSVPDAAKTTSTSEHNFAIRNLYLGDQVPGTFATPPANMPAWANFGYNIDGLITTATSTDVCTLNSNSSGTATQTDGTNGIDNSFGENIIPLIANVGATSQSISTGDIQEGKFTLMFDTIGLDGTATQTATGLTGQLFAGSTYGSTPPANGAAGSSFAVTDDWPVNGSLLMNPSSIASGSKIKFSDAFVSGGSWVSGTPTDVQVTLTLMGYALQLTIHQGVISMPISVDSAGQYHSTVGLVSGVLETSEFVNALNVIGAQIGQCSLISTVALPIIEGSQDIVLSADGNSISNTKGTACNAISIGLAFDADEIKVPDTIAPTADAGTPVAPCGADGGS